MTNSFVQRNAHRDGFGCRSCPRPHRRWMRRRSPAKWPEKTVRIVAAGPAGGSADIVARLLADDLAKEIGQPVSSRPKPGAGGVLAVNELSQAPHDGHTLLVGVNSLVSEIPHIVKLRVDMAKEIKPVAELARGGLVMVGAPSVPAKNFAELVGWVKANPGKVNYASYTAGHDLARDGPAAQQGGRPRHDPRRLQGLDARADRRDGRPRAADVRRHGHLAAADQVRQDQGLCGEHAQALAAAARCADLRRARLSAARGRRRGWACGSSPTCLRRCRPSCARPCSRCWRSPPSRSACRKSASSRASRAAPRN